MVFWEKVAPKIYISKIKKEISTSQWRVSLKEKLKTNWNKS